MDTLAQACSTLYRVKRRAQRAAGHAPSQALVNDLVIDQRNSEVSEENFEEHAAGCLSTSMAAGDLFAPYNALATPGLCSQAMSNDASSSGTSSSGACSSLAALGRGTEVVAQAEASFSSRRSPYTKKSVGGTTTVDLLFKRAAPLRKLRLHAPVAAAQLALAQLQRAVEREPDLQQPSKAVKWVVQPRGAYLSNLQFICARCRLKAKSIREASVVLRHHPRLHFGPCC